MDKKSFPRPKDSYALVNSKGEIVAKFRLKQTAITMMHDFKEYKSEEMKIVSLEEDEEKTKDLNS